MFCKFCGRQIDPNLRECPYCSVRQEARSGGNGFWDILTSREKTAHEVMPDIHAEPPAAGQEKTSFNTQKKSMFPAAMMLVLLLGTICNFAVGIVEISTLADLERELISVKKEGESTARNVEGEIEKLSKTILKIQATDPTVNGGPHMPGKVTGEGETAQPTFFVSQPEDSPLQNGRAVFSVEIAEANPQLTIQWEYKIGNAEWQLVTEENSDFLVETGSYQSSLTVLSGNLDLKDMQFRCCVAAEGETTYSREVRAILQ